MAGTEKIPVLRNGLAKTLGQAVGPLLAAAFAAGGFWAVMNERVKRLEEERPAMIQAVDQLKAEVYELKLDMVTGLTELKSEVKALRRKD